MSLEKYYNIEEQIIEENTSSFVIALVTNHIMYKGHFPEFPLLPGAVQIELIQELLALSVGKELQLSKAKSIKYLGMINPNENHRLKIDLQWKTDNFIKLKASIKSYDNEEKIMLKYSAEYNK